jgi:hypothetical protein
MNPIKKKQLAERIINEAVQKRTLYLAGLITENEYYGEQNRDYYGTANDPHEKDLSPNLTKNKLQSILSDTEYSEIADTYNGFRIDYFDNGGINKAKQLLKNKNIKFKTNEFQNDKGMIFIYTKLASKEKPQPGGGSVGKAFNKSPQYHSYDEVKNMIDVLDDSEISDAFEEQFGNQSKISRKEYWDFITQFPMEGEDDQYAMANWVALSDDKIFKKLGLY